MVPASPAAREAAASPFGQNMRQLPTGASSTGNAMSVPRTLVRSWAPFVTTAERGRSATSSKTRQFSRSVTSPSAPPSM